MDASKSRPRNRDAEISERLGLFVAPSLRAETPTEPDAENDGVRSFVSRQLGLSSGGLKKRLATEELATATDPGYVADMFRKRDPRRGPTGARRS